MNVQVENLPNCVTTLHVEVPPEKVSAAWDDIAKDYARYAKIPGYRPGKAPRNVIEKKFQKEIREELRAVGCHCLNRARLGVAIVGPMKDAAEIKGWLK